MASDHPAPGRAGVRSAGPVSLIVALSLAVVALGPASPAEADRPDVAERHRYLLEATLDPETHEVLGEASIRWTNESREPARELWLHLYMNAFESEDTVFMRESGGSLRGVSAADIRGGIELLTLETAAGRDLLAGAEDEVIRGDRTQMRVPLPEPVGPGETIELRSAFRTTLPPLFARAGYADGFHVVAQWFPKVARREPDGDWASFPYHGRSEFYADFARYELDVTVPAEVVVGATGDLLARTVGEGVEDGMARYRFAAEPVHDAAFVAWSHFRVREEALGPVTARFLYPPGYEAAVHQHVRVTDAGLRLFEGLFGSYPYDSLTVIVPPRGAEGGAGMEYPTLFLTAGPWFHVPGMRLGLHETVTAHELAHQWFQGLVATNEHRWPMLDEGITQWATGELMRHLYGQSRSGLDMGPVHLDFFQVMRSFSLRAGPPTPPPGSPAPAFDEGDYGRAVYGQPAVVLETVGRTWGHRRLTQALGRYARRHRFAHPGPADLFAAFDSVYWPGFSERILAPALMEGETAEVMVTDLRTRRDGDAWVAEVDVRRAGSLPIPTWVELRTEAGERVRIPFPSGQRRLLATHRGPSRVRSAVVDPDGHLLLDPSVLDNVRGWEPAGDSTRFGRILFAFQRLLARLGP